MSFLSSPPPAVTLGLQILAPTLALTTSSYVLAYGIFLARPLRNLADSTPAQSLALLRAYFEAGKPIFPNAALINTLLYSYLAYLSHIHGPGNTTKLYGYIAAALGSFWIIPFSALYLIPYTNDRILELDDLAKKVGDDGVKEKGDGKGGVKEVQEYMKRFENQNYWRGGVYWAVGGIVGLWASFV